MVQPLVLIHGLGGEIHAELVEDLDIDRGEHHRGVHLAAAELGELCQRQPGGFVRGSTHGECDENLVRVETGIVASQVIGLQGLDGLNG